jgi:hypothetical protein
LNSENSEKRLKKYFIDIENFEIFFLMLEVFFFFKKEKFPWKFASEAGRFRELDHKQYEFKPMHYNA